MSRMVSIHIDATQRVAYKLAEQASVHTQIAATLAAKGSSAEDLRHVTEHEETARLFALLHTAVVGGLLDRLQDEALLVVTT